MDIFEFSREQVYKKEANNIISETAHFNIFSSIINSTLKQYSRVLSFTKVVDTVLGDYSYLNSHSQVHSTTIGKFTSIGPQVMIGLPEHNPWVSTHTFYLRKDFGGFIEEDLETENTDRTIIGNDVWIGAGAIILKGVRVGDGAIIGAGSVVTKDVVPYSVNVGVPARVIRFRFSDEDIRFLLGTKWWDFDRDIIKDMVQKQVWSDIGKFKEYIFCQVESNKVDGDE